MKYLDKVESIFIIVKKAFIELNKIFFLEGESPTLNTLI